MYAVIGSGGKQERVEAGQRVAVELLGASVGEEISFSPLLVVDGSRVLSTRADLQGATVTARVVAEVKGPKIKGFTYKPKSNNRRHYGHRQRYHEIEVTGIDPDGKPAGTAPARRAPAGEGRAGTTEGAPDQDEES
ncbi:MAG: 50S ribosomal protein L21 [Acidimicrobiales bacterium]